MVCSYEGVAVFVSLCVFDMQLWGSSRILLICILLIRVLLIRDFVRGGAAIVAVISYLLCFWRRFAARILAEYVT